jgi:hypothetical protein
MDTTDPQEVEYGPLTLCFTSEYSLQYKDKGSGAEKDAGFWHPKPAPGFHALGSIAMPNYTDPNGKVGTLTMKANSTAKKWLQKPTGYTKIWTDKGNEADMDGRVRILFYQKDTLPWEAFFSLDTTSLVPTS